MEPGATAPDGPPVTQGESVAAETHRRVVEESTNSTKRPAQVLAVCD